MTPDIVLTAGIAAVALLFVGVPVVVGKTITRADREDKADVPFAPDTEKAIEQNLALVNSQPLCEAIVDELALRRRATS